MPKSRTPFQRRKVCRFCADKGDSIDIFDPRTLRYFVSERGKIIPRRISGNCAKHQREVIEAIKRLRNLGINQKIKIAVGDIGARGYGVGPHGPNEPGERCQKPPKKK